MNLSERVVIVSHGDSVVGRAICGALSIAGAHAVPVRFGQDVEPEDPQSWRNFLGTLPSDDVFGLVMSFGDSEYGTLTEQDPDEFAAAVRRHATPFFAASNAIIPLMVTGGKGSIVSIVSGFTDRPRKGYAAYLSAHATVRMLSKSIAVDFAAAGIRSNILLAGGIDCAPLPPGMDRETMLKGLRAKIPLGQTVSAQDIAASVKFLMSDAASFMHGAELPLDGALRLANP
ncbi:MAG: SDR family oxidoreductase [Phycisphaerae bacterium]|nr:SDR family oxidoreductase [Phycisphaerae bacterium]